MTRSFFANSASRALSSVTSREMGWAFLTPSESFFALPTVLHALMGQLRAAKKWEKCRLTNSDLDTCITKNVEGRTCYEACSKHENFPKKQSDLGVGLRSCKLTLILP